MTFALSSSLAYSADVISRTSAALTPGTLFTALFIPTPVPQIQIPKSAFPLVTCSPTFFRRLDNVFL